MSKKLTGVLLLLLCLQVKAQNGSIIAGQDTSRNPITTAVPFLGINPDARSGGMGDVGGAISPDANATYWNPAKIAFIEQQSGFALSYTPWLGNIVDDMSLVYLTGYTKLDRTQAVSASLLYFDLGDIQLTDNSGSDLENIRPREFALSATYSRKLSEKLGIGATARYIHSNISDGFSSTLNSAQPGTSFAVDLGLYYNKDLIKSSNNSNLAYALTISNIGSKITYNSSENKDFIPINLRLAGAYKTDLDPYNSITVALDVNKLLVPTPPVYGVDDNGDPIIVNGKDPERTLLSGMFGSFGDAPNGFSEEMQEFMIALGVEYWYQNFFAARTGYFYEDADKGNRRFFTLGLGLRYQKFGIDFAYLIPQIQNHPLAETLRFTLHFNFEGANSDDVIPSEI